MLAVRSEKRRIFEQNVLPELDVLFAAALYLSRSEEEANDLCEKTMVLAYRSFSVRAASAPNLRAWLLTILHEIVRAESSQARSESAASVAAESASTSALAPVAAANSDAGVDRALQSLPDDFKAAVVMVDVAALTYREAAKVLAVPIETVRVRISKGRALMRGALAPMGGRGGLARA